MAVFPNLKFAFATCLKRKTKGNTKYAIFQEPVAKARVPKRKAIQANNHQLMSVAASHRGFGNNDAKFYVHPSRSCAKFRYMRVRTASAP